MAIRQLSEEQLRDSNLEPICAGVIAGGALMGIAVNLLETFVL